MCFDAPSVTKSDHFGAELDSHGWRNVLIVLVGVLDELVDEVGLAHVGVTRKND